MRRPRIALWVCWHVGVRSGWCPTWLWHWATRRAQRWYEDPKCGKFDHVEIDTPMRWKPLTVNEPDDWTKCRVMKDDR